MKCKNTIEKKHEKSSYAEMLCHFNQTPREDGYFPSELFHGRRVRSHLPSLDDTVDIDKGKAARELKDMVVKNATKIHKPLKLLNVGDLCYRRHFDGKKDFQNRNYLQGNRSLQEW